MLEETHYYPFGLAMAGISDKALKENYAQNKFRYNGKELQNQEFNDGTGLEEYDYGKRFYDPQLGRFFNLDPSAENYKSFSPYMYGANNPLRFIDIDGLGPGDRIKKAEELEGHKYSQEAGLNTGTELRTGNSPEALDYLDCSEFVCRVLAYDGITSGVKAMSTKELVDFLGDDDKFIRSENEPEPGDIFLWREGDEGHTGVVVSYNKNTGDVETSEARGKKFGSLRVTRDISVFTGMDGWKGFYHPKKENPDKKDNKNTKKENSNDKFKRLMNVSEESLKKSLKVIEQQKASQEADKVVQQQREERGSILQ
jgi:RHS repeat-associated protein